MPKSEKSIIGPNVNTKIIKRLSENLGENLCHLAYANILYVQKA